MDQHNDKSQPPPAAWIEALERGRAGLTAGRTIPLASFLARLDERIAQAEARQPEDMGTDAGA